MLVKLIRRKGKNNQFLIMNIKLYVLKIPLDKTNLTIWICLLVMKMMKQYLTMGKLILILKMKDIIGKNKLLWIFKW